MSRAVPAPLRCRRPSCISLMQSLRMARRCAADVADAAGAACGVGAWSPRRFAPPVSGGLAQPGPAAAWRARVPRAGCGQPAQQKYGAQRFTCSTLTSMGKIDSQKREKLILKRRARAATATSGSIDRAGCRTHTQHTTHSSTTTAVYTTTTNHLHNNNDAYPSRDPGRRVHGRELRRPARRQLDPGEDPVRRPSIAHSRNAWAAPRPGGRAACAPATAR